MVLVALVWSVLRGGALVRLAAIVEWPITWIVPTSRCGKSLWYLEIHPCCALQWIWCASLLRLLRCAMSPNFAVSLKLYRCESPSPGQTNSVVDYFNDVCAPLKER